MAILIKLGNYKEYPRKMLGVSNHPVTKRIQRIINSNVSSSGFDHLLFSSLPYLIEDFYSNASRKKHIYPATIYHYTSFDAALSFLMANTDGTTLSKESHGGRGALWLRSTAWMNDRNELSIGNKVLKSFIRKQYDPELEKKYVKNLNKHACVFSMSTRPDYIPLWEAYGQKGAGCMMAFDRSLLMDVAPTSAIFGRVTYDQSKFKHLLHFLFIDVKSRFGSRAWENNLEMIQKYWVPSLPAFCKVKDFEHEEEYRLYVHEKANQVQFGRTPSFPFFAYDVGNHAIIGNAAKQNVMNERYHQSDPLKEVLTAQNPDIDWFNEIVCGPNMSGNNRETLKTAVFHSKFNPSVSVSESSLKF
jgi:hypothetical protein